MPSILLKWLTGEGTGFLNNLFHLIKGKNYYILPTWLGCWLSSTSHFPMLICFFLIYAGLFFFLLNSFVTFFLQKRSYFHSIILDNTSKYFSIEFKQGIEGELFHCIYSVHHWKFSSHFISSWNGLLIFHPHHRTYKK